MEPLAVEQLYTHNTAWSKSMFVIIIVALMMSQYSLGVTGLADHTKFVFSYTCVHVRIT